MISTPSVIPVILSLFWFAVAIFGFWCCLYGVWRFLDQIYQLFKY